MLWENVCDIYHCEKLQVCIVSSHFKNKQYDLKEIYQNINKEIKLSSRASLVAQLVKTPPAMQKTQVRFLGLEDPLDKEMATHSSILA